MTRMNTMSASNTSLPIIQATQRVESESAETDTSIGLNKDKSGPKRGLIFADTFIPGRGEPQKYAALAFEVGGKILWTGSANRVPTEYAHLSVTHVPYLMPGLWDCHVHLMGSTELALDQVVLLDKALAGARIARDLAAMLNAGYTSCRELAGYGFSVAKAVDEGWLPGPHIYSSVSILSQTAGHGDAHSLPAHLITSTQDAGGPFHLCDGVDECVKAVRTKVRQGAKLIKVAATGGVLSILDDPRSTQFSPEELSAIVKEAAKTGKIVAAHCHGKEGIIAALNAGCRTIEHGTYLDDECLELFKEKDAMLIATRSIVDFGVQHPEQMIPEIYKKILETNKYHKAAYAKAVKAGVRVALGTDLGISRISSGHYFGMNGRELGFAVEVGMTELQAIEAATANGPDTLGPLAPKSGQLVEGYDADFIALSENPLKDISVVARPNEITHVWKGGHCYKKPGHPVGFFPMTCEP